MAPSTDEPPAGAQPASSDDEERLGTRRSFWGRMRHRFGGSGLPTKHANDDLGATAVSGDDPSRSIGPLGPFGPFGH